MLASADLGRLRDRDGHLFLKWLDQTHEFNLSTAGERCSKALSGCEDVYLIPVRYICQASRIALDHAECIDPGYQPAFIGA